MFKKALLLTTLSFFTLNKTFATGGDFRDQSKIILEEINGRIDMGGKQAQELENLRALGKKYYKKRNFPEAIKYYGKFLAIAPDDEDINHAIIDAYVQCVQQYQDEGDLKEAVNCLKEALTSHPVIFESLNKTFIALAQKCLENGEFEEAIYCFNKALEIAPENDVAFYGIVDVYIQLAQALNAEGKLEEAATYYNKALELHPKSKKAQRSLAELYIRLGRIEKNAENFEEAIAHYNKALKIFPKSKDAGNGLSDIYFILGTKNSEDRAYYYKKALEVCPKMAKLMNALGERHKGSGNLNEAIICFKKTLKFFPKNTTALRFLKDIYLELGYQHKDSGNFEKATEYFEKALKLFPRNKKARQGIEDIKAAKECLLTPVFELDEKAEKIAVEALLNLNLSASTATEKRTLQPKKPQRKSKRRKKKTRKNKRRRAK